MRRSKAWSALSRNRGRLCRRNLQRESRTAAQPTNAGEKRFHVSIAMEAPQVFDTDRRGRRPRAMRKERRQGRIVFLVLLVALGFAVMLLVSHLHL